MLNVCAGIDFSYSGVCYKRVGDDVCVGLQSDQQIITTKGGAVGGISIPSEVVQHLDTSAFKIIVLVIWVVDMCVDLRLHQVWKDVKSLLGEIQCAPQLSGYQIQYICNTWIPSGGKSALESAQFMTLVYTPSVTTTTAGDIGHEHYGCSSCSGGMPISGGA